MFDFIKLALKKLLSFVFKFSTRGITMIVTGIYLIIKIIFGKFFLVWSFMRGYFWVSHIMRLFMYPVLAFAFYFIIKYAYMDMPLPFLENQSVNNYIISFIQNYDFLINLSVIGYKIGIWQALTMFFNFVILTFIIKLFIRIFSRI